VAGEAVGLDRGDVGRDVEHLGRLGEADDVVFERLPVDRLDAESHLRLLVDKQELGVLRRQDFELRVGHGSSPLTKGSAVRGWAAVRKSTRRWALLIFCTDF